MNHIFLFIALALATIVGCHAQTSVDVYVTDSVHVPSGYYFSTRFIGVKRDASTGIATVNFIGGDEADNSYVLSFESHDQSDPFAWDTTYPITFGATGTFWIYLALYGTTTNYDWIEVRVVASSFSGTITPLYGTAPSGWWYGYPPYYVPMVTGTVPPPSQPAPVSISKILVPILVVVIVLAITIPAGVYMYRRRQAKKMMETQLQASTPENQVPVQMNSVVV